MASSYALPQSGMSNYVRTHQAFPSLDGISLDQSTPQKPFPNGHHTHHDHEDSHEEHDHFHANGHSTMSHGYSHSQRLPMKGRLRGESDLGRPNTIHNDVAGVKHPSSAPSLLLEVFQGTWIPLCCHFVAAAYRPTHEAKSTSLPLSAHQKLHDAVLGSQEEASTQSPTQSSALVQACSLASGTLLLVGMMAQIRVFDRLLDRQKTLQGTMSVQWRSLASVSSLRKMAQNALSVALLFYATLLLGGPRAGLLTLVAFASGLICAERPPVHSSAQILKYTLSSHRAGLLIMGLAVMVDVFNSSRAALLDLGLGYLVLFTTFFFINPPFPTTHTRTAVDSPVAIKLMTPMDPNKAFDKTPRFAISTAVSPLIASTSDSLNTLVAGLLLSCITVAMSVFFTASPPVSFSALACSASSMGIMTALIFFAHPDVLRTKHKMGLLTGCVLSAFSSFLYSSSIWTGIFLDGALSALAYIAILYDTSSLLPNSSHDHDHQDHVHTGHKHRHNHAGHGDVSFFTNFLLERTESGSLMHGILCEKDSRRIAYFTCLNFAFMLVQAFYGWVSGSLGLLSDTVHMFFDCLALVVGLGAAVASKWPTSIDKPYGWGKLNTLAGFGNGIFLMLVSVEFVWEAVEGIMEGKELRHVLELLVVSTLGLVVNMVGLLAFGHAHAGHDHGHGHSHGHDHHAHAHDHGHSHSQSHGSISGHEKVSQAQSQHHHHGHGNENMHGIYLHVAADAGGSLAVIVSTIMTLWKPWYLWDPLATIIIAILIFAAAVPLVQESGRKLLLVIPDELEYGLKNALQELVTLRGVTGYAVPRFWVDEGEAQADPHAHHEHEHDHHGHDHGHDHKHDHGAGEEEADKQAKIMGVIHVFASRAASTDDVRERVSQFFRDRNMDVVVQVEREGEGHCWCGGGNKTT